MTLSGTKKITTLLLAAALTLLAGCGGTAGTDTQSGDDYVEGQIAGTEARLTYAADSVFSLNSDAESGFNPYTTSSADNRLADQLVYENIFEVDDDYNLSSRIITKYETSDGLYWYFYVDTGIEMHDGTNLTAADVAYSLQQAARSSRYSGRFSYLWGTSATGDDVFCVTLSKADLMLPYLLTVPVVKYGSIGEDTPAGTGPYRFSDDKTSLKAFDGYPGYADLPVDTVYLKEYDTVEDTIAAYESSKIDLALNDPTNSTNLGYGGNNEVRTYTTTNLHYLGVNMSSPFLQYASCRYALQFAVDRKSAAQDLLQGAAVADALPIPPSSPLYDASLASGLAYDLDRCLLVLNNSDVEDYDGDGKLEYPVTGVPMEISLDLIVCSESTGKADIAKMIAEDLAGIGLTVNVRELSWDDYQTALQTGDFDLYYGEVALTADFDLSRLLTEGGSLNYCGITDPAYAQYIDQYLASDDDTRQANCSQMLSYIAETAPIIPICFERRQVISHRNVISGMDPGPYNIFFDITNWRMNLDIEEEETP